MKKLDKHIEDAIENIGNDRALALTLLTDLMKSMHASHDHKELGQIASKYLETLQRSNEQLVKVSTLIQKQQASLSDGLSDDDKADIFDMLQDSGEEDVE